MILLLIGPKEDDHGLLSGRRSILLSLPAGAAGGSLSESRAKRGDRIVGTDTELLEKLGRNDPCPCGSGRRFRRCCRRTARFDGAQADYYVRDQ